MILQRWLLLIAILVCAAALSAQPIENVLPLNNGAIRVRSTFIEREAIGPLEVVKPVLRATIINETGEAWLSLKFRFEMGGVCDGEQKKWQTEITTSIGWRPDGNVEREVEDTIIPLVGKIDGCIGGASQATLVAAINMTHTPAILGSPTPDGISEALDKIKIEWTAQQARKAAEQEENEKAASERQAKITALEYELEKAEEKEAAERRAFCKTTYQNTADKKVSDLTVKQDQAVRLCQAADLYYR